MTTSGPVKRDGEGVLNCLVLQPSDVSPQITRDGGGRYAEVWKGPYDVIKDYPSSVFVYGTTRAAALAAVGLTVVARFDAPDPGKDRYGNELVWTVLEAVVQEQTAGDHGILRVTYTNDYDEDATEAFAEDPAQDLWNLSWQSYSVSPYAFCGNGPVEDNPASVGETDWDKGASRINIEKCLQSGKASTDFVYPSAARGYELQLTKAEQLIATKIIQGKGCVYHYPVLTHQTVKYKYVASQISAEGADAPEYPDSDVGEDIDHVIATELPDGCPYAIPSKTTNSMAGSDADKWRWIKVGDDMSMAVTDVKLGKNKVTYTRRTTWWGFKEIDENFYGNDVMTPGGGEDLTDKRLLIGAV